MPNVLPTGTVKLWSRQPCDHVIGLLHCVFRFGPVGPLKKAGWSSPQRPWKSIHGNAVRASAGSLGIVSIAGRRLVVRAVRVVAADALLGRAPEEEPVAVEVGVRAGRRVDDRMGAVDEVELVVAPARLLRAFVLAVADAGRLLLERVARVRGVELELDHLPVAFVQVVPVVVDVEEPVLQRKPPRVGGLGCNVGVHRRLVPLGDEARPPFVAAARGERVARKVEVIVVEPTGEIPAIGPILTRSAAFHGPRNATVGWPKSASTSSGW